MKVLIHFHHFLHIIPFNTLSSKTTTTAFLIFSPSPTLLLRHHYHPRSLFSYSTASTTKTRTVSRLMSSTTTSSSSKKNNENKNKNRNNNNNNNLLTVLSLPKIWQDFDSKKDDTFRIDPRRIFGDKDDNNKYKYKYKYKHYANINNTNDDNDNDNDMENDGDDDTSAPASTPTPTPTPTSWSYDTIIDMNKYNSNDMIVSFDLDLYMEENHQKIEQEEKVEEEENKKRRKKKKQSHHVHVHLNRDATENADRAYKRLEISIMKKILLKSKSKKNKSRKKQQKNNNDGTSSSSSSLCTTRLFTSTSTTTTITTTKKDTTKTAIAPFTNNTITNINNRRQPIHIDELSTIELSKKIESLLLHCKNSQEQEDDTTTTTTTTSTNTTTSSSSSLSSSSVGLELSIPSLSDDADADADADQKGRSNNDNDGTHHKNNIMKLSPNSNNNNNSNTNFQFNVLSNPPVILATYIFESFQSKLFVGIPIVIQTTLLHATRAEVSWFVGKSKNNSSGHKYDDNIDTNKEKDKGEEEHEEFELELHDSHSFVPQARHIGKTLYVVIRPVRDGYHSDHDGSSSISRNKCFKEAFKFENLIENLPFMPIVSPLRDEFTAAKQSSSSSLSSSSFSTIRMCTYNVLADLYVSRQLDDGTTTYPHVKNYDHIKKNRRIPMIVGELLAYRSDIICLQEVDGSVYDTYLEPVFQSMGYDGYYSNKASSQREGCAMFWLRDIFDIDKAEVFNVSDLFQSDIDNNDIDDSDDEKQNNATTNNMIEDDNNPEKGTNLDSMFSQTRWDSMKDINLLLESHNELRKVVMEKVGQVAQIATLKLKNPIEGQQPKFLIVANTHLFYHPLADHIRAMQVYVVLKKIDEVRRRRHHSCSDNSCLEEEYPYPFMFCGDLNSDPLSGASQLIYTRSLASDQHDCWKYLYKYQWDWDVSDDEDAIITEHDESKYRNNDTAVDIIERNDDTMRQDKMISISTGSKPLSTACTTGRSPPPPFIQLPGSFPILQSGCKEMPKFTNYAPGFVDTLDYIFGSQASKNEIFGFQPKRSAPMPSIKDVEPFFAMPNEVMPSDHVSIVCDFEWCRYQR